MRLHTENTPKMESSRRVDSSSIIILKLSSSNSEESYDLDSENCHTLKITFRLKYMSKHDIVTVVRTHTLMCMYSEYVVYDGLRH